MTDLPALLARVEALTAPDRALDAEIACALRLVPQFDPSIFIVPLEYRPGDRDGWITVDAVHPNGDRWVVHGREVPCYSASVDAVLAIVPERCDWSLYRRHSQFCAILFTDRGYTSPWLPTPALALLAAVLRARIGEGEA